MDPNCVIVLTSSYPRHRGDSASVFLQYLCSSLVNKGITVHVVAPASDGADTQLDDGVCIHRFRYLPRRLRKLSYGSGIVPNLQRNPILWLTVPFFLVSMLFTLVQTARRTKAGIIHCHWVVPQGFVGLLSRPFHSAKIVVSAHGTDAFGLRSRFARSIKRYTINKSDWWTANTRMTARAISESEFPSRLSVIPMGISVDLFRSGNRSRLRHNIPDSKTILLFVGRLIEKKGLPELLRAFALLPLDIRNNSFLWIVGDGKLRRLLETEVDSLNLADQVTFWGARPNRELPDFYAAADIFVGPSESEGQGVVFLEAFAAGLPIVATSAGGITEIVENGQTGLLVRPGDPGELCNAISRLVKDKALRETLAQNASHEIATRYDWDVISSRFQILYSDLSRQDKTIARRKIPK
jgi:glycosyltransferase involved in cell wall biosynthesis